MRARLANVGRRVRYSTSSFPVTTSTNADCLPCLLPSDVSQGYATNRSTPYTTPQASPSKPAPTNPNNTPAHGGSVQSSPLKLFRTEHEVIREAAEEVEANTNLNPNTNIVVPPFNLKRGRIDEDEDDYEDNYEDGEDEYPEEADANEEGEEANQDPETNIPKRTLKPLPQRKKAKRSIKPQNNNGNTAGQDEEPNPFLVS